MELSACKKGPRFEVDFMLGKLAKILRMLGFDTKYIRDWNREDILADTLKGGRVLLTRAHKFSQITSVFIVESETLKEQLR